MNGNTYALIQGNLVVNLICAQAAFLSAAPPWWASKWDQMILVGALTSYPSVPVGVGWTWDGGTSFTPPPDAPKEKGS